MSSNTTARPRWHSSDGSAAAGLMIAPFGHKFPRNTAMHESCLSGAEAVRITSRSKTSAPPHYPAVEALAAIEVLGDRAPEHGRRVRIEVTGRVHLGHDRAHPAGGVEVLHQ